MRTNLNVPFHEKNKAKELGAQWDQLNKTWYSENTRDLSRFKPWLPKDIPLVQLENSESKPVLTNGLTLSSFLNKIKQNFDQHCALSSWVRAEIIEFKDNGGHCYLTLAEYAEDESNMQRQEKARINCTLWKNKSAEVQNKFLKATGSKVEPGMKIMLLVKAEYSTKYGVSLNIQDIDPNYTLGDLQANLQKIRKTLQAEGIYKLNKQLPVPNDFHCIAVVSPENAAGLGDFQKEAHLLQQYGLCRFDYYEAVFQGECASQSLCSSLKEVKLKASLYDAVVIIRGGGAVADLAWLNNLELARVVSTLGLPVFTGIGHEKDNTILDEIVCCRFDTPSKVSHHILIKICSNAQQAENDYTRISHSIDGALKKINDKLVSLMNTVKVSVNYATAKVTNEIQFCMKSLFVVRQSFTAIENKIDSNYKMFSYASRTALQNAESILSETYNRTIENSFCFIENKNNAIENMCQEIKNASQSLVKERQQNINYLNQAIISSFAHEIKLQEQSLISQYAAIKGNAHTALEGISHKVEGYILQVLPQDPVKTLQRGFTLTRDATGRLINSYVKAKTSTDLEIEFHDGKLKVLNTLEE